MRKFVGRILIAGVVLATTCGAEPMPFTPPIAQGRWGRITNEDGVAGGCLGGGQMDGVIKPAADTPVELHRFDQSACRPQDTERPEPLAETRTNADGYYELTADVGVAWLCRVNEGKNGAGGTTVVGIACIETEIEAGEVRRYDHHIGVAEGWRVEGTLVERPYCERTPPDGGAGEGGNGG